MIGEVIKEYLVSLGVQIDKPGFAAVDSTINKTSNTISTATGGWAKDFIKASGIISAALAGVTTSVVGVMTSAAKQDLAMDKYARSMMISKEAAWEMKQAVDALGESVQDIQLNPELFGRYRALVNDGRSMKVGGDYSETMKDFRDLIFEFTRLKQEAGYALQWVSYYLMKHLTQPLADAKKGFKGINDSIIKNMPVWTEKIARALVYIINIGRSFWSFIKAIGKSIYEMWDAFPHGVKIATAALTGFFMLLKATPLGRMIALVSTLLLLIDDYFGHMEGREAAFGDVWDKLNEYIATAKEKLESLAPVWEKLIGYVDQAESIVKELAKALMDLADGISSYVIDVIGEFIAACEKYGVMEKITARLQKWFDIASDLVKVIAEVSKAVSEWFKELGQSEEVQEYMDALGELVSVVLDLIDVITDLANDAFRAFFGELGKTGIVFTFRDTLREVTKVMSAIVRTVSAIIRGLTDLFKMMKDSKTFEAFWQGMSKVVRGFSDLILDAIGRVGKLGRALLALVNGDFKIAKKLADEAVFGKAEAGERSFQFSGGKIPTGIISSEHEGAVDSLGGDSTGGPSYGSYQIAEETMPSFIEWLSSRKKEYSNVLASAGEVGSDSFDAAWVKIARNDWDGFHQLQHDFIAETHYADQVNSIKRLGVDLDQRSETLREVVWSMAVQMRDFTPRIFKSALEGQSIDEITDEELIPKLYEYRKHYFSKSTESERASVFSRYDNEELPMALNMLKQERELVRQQKEAAAAKPDTKKQQGFAIENPSPTMREPTVFDRAYDDWRTFWDKVKDKLNNAALDADPNLVSGLMSSQYFNPVSNSSGLSVFNRIEVGVNVADSNASAQDIGNAVATQTVSKLEERSRYVLQNRTLNGGPTWT